LSNNLKCTTKSELIGVLAHAVTNPMKCASFALATSSASAIVARPSYTARYFHQLRVSPLA
jgi:hypothetical protein